jgi:hypothetical protein
MPRRKQDLFKNTFLLIATLFFIYLWIKSPGTSLYSVQLSALLIIFYFLNHEFARKKPSPFTDALIITTITLLLVANTGGLASPLFFLAYFLLFGTALMFAPSLIIIHTSGLIIFFAFSGPLETLENYIALFSLFLISPLAIFFGKQYLRLLEGEKKIKILEKSGQKLKQSLEKEETDSLMWLSLDLKDGLLRIIDKTAEVLSKPADFSWRQKENLEAILASAQRLLRTGEKLKEEIDKATD